VSLLKPLWVVAVLAMIGAIAALMWPDSGVVYAFPVSGVDQHITAVGQLLLLVLTCAFVPSVAMALRDRKDIITLHFLMLLVGVLLALFTLAAFFRGAGRVEIAGILRPEVGLLDGGLLGIAFTPLIPLVLAYAWLGAPPSRGRSLARVSFVILLLGTVLTFSRITWIAVATEGVAIGWLVARYRTIQILVVVAIIILTSLFTVRIPGLQLFDPQQVYGAERLRIWVDAWNIYLRHPWLGVGMGNFQFFDRSLTVDISGAGITHNQYLTVLAESGPLAFGVFVLFVCRLLKWLWHWGNEYSEFGRLAAATFAATLGFAVWGFAGDTFFVSASYGGGTLFFSLTVYYWLLLGSLLALGLHSKPTAVEAFRS
jgi:O-antigen ligase